MKKKLTIATVLILLLAVCLTMLVGCDEMFTRNEERDATQVVASVNYKGLSANIYKFELQSSFNNYAYMYVNYYQMSYEDAANYVLRSLAQQKLLTLYAREKVAELLHLEAIPDKVEDMLTRSEIDKAIDDTNESLLSGLKDIVEKQITDDNYNSGTSEPSKKDEDDGEDEEITDGVYIRFESNGGSEVERQRYQKGTVKAKAPTAPTKDGYVFYGWYLTEDFAGDHFDESGKFVSGEYDFATQLNNDVTLYAKWVETTAARTEIPEPAEEEDDDDYDPDINDPNFEISPKFYTDAYKATIADEFKDEDFVEKINAKLGRTLNDYIDDGIAELTKRLKANIFKNTENEIYEYYLANQMDSVLVEKMQRLIGETVNVSDQEIEDEFNLVVRKNKQTFSGANAESSYSSALTSTLSGTYYHKILDADLQARDSYGFVINILLKLGEDDLKTLTEMCKANPNPAGVEAAKIMRNRLISKMTVKVSNPKYKSSEKVEDAEGNEIELRDPMTDPKNPYNDVGIGGAKKATYDQTYQVEGGNNYNQLISFVKNDDGEFEIKFGATEHPAMAYLLEEVPAFDKDDKTGIIHQIHNSLNQVMAFVTSGDLSKEQGVYWLREVATKWLYLVGDDSGAVTDSSNNNGLGYLVTPEGEDSSFLEDFTTYARDLIKQGTGSFAVGDVDDSLFVGAAETGDGAMAGNGKAYVVADSFIGNGTTSFDNAYAGVFVLLNSYTVWDPAYYGGELLENGTLPMDYKLTVAKDEDDIKTISETIYDSLLEAKKSRVYNLDINTMGVEYMETGIEYYEKAYKSIWKEAEKASK